MEIMRSDRYYFNGIDFEIKLAILIDLVGINIGREPLVSFFNVTREHAYAKYTMSDCYRIVCSDKNRVGSPLGAMNGDYGRVATEWVLQEILRARRYRAQEYKIRLTARSKSFRLWSMKWIPFMGLAIHRYTAKSSGVTITCNSLAPNQIRYSINHTYAPDSNEWSKR